MKGTCTRCGMRERVAPLPKRFGCATCGQSPFCYACDVTHNAWCSAAHPSVSGLIPTTPEEK